LNKKGVTAIRHNPFASKQRGMTNLKSAMPLDFLLPDQCFNPFPGRADLSVLSATTTRAEKGSSS
jgi:hypothetical protein